MSTHVVTASREQVDWAISVMDDVADLFDQADEAGVPIEINDGASMEFGRANALLTAVSITAFGLADKVDAQAAEIAALKAERDDIKLKLDDRDRIFVAMLNTLEGLVIPSDPTGWEYPAQVIRHVADNTAELKAEIASLREALSGLVDHCETNFYNEYVKHEPKAMDAARAALKEE